MAEWLKALVSKTGIPFTGYRGFESPFFRKRERHRSEKCGAFFVLTEMTGGGVEGAFSAESMPLPDIGASISRMMRGG